MQQRHRNGFAIRGCDLKTTRHILRRIVAARDFLSLAQDPATRKLWIYNYTQAAPYTGDMGAGGIGFSMTFPAAGLGALLGFALLLLVKRSDRAVWLTALIVYVVAAFWILALAVLTTALTLLDPQAAAGELALFFDTALVRIQQK